MSLSEQTPASSVIPSLAFIVQPSLSQTFKQSEKAIAAQEALMKAAKERAAAAAAAKAAAAVGNGAPAPAPAPAQAPAQAANTEEKKD